MRFKTIIRYKNPKQPELGKIRKREDDLEIQKGRWRMKRERSYARASSRGKVVQVVLEPKAGCD